KKVASILKKACEDVTFKKSKRKKNYFKKKENAVYLVKNPKLSTIAHELFHKVDHDNEITRNRLLEDCINSDYENLRKIAEKAGLSLEDMLYLKYPEAFEEKGRMKEEYRGFSDIIHGMTLQKVNLGYGHYEDGYWEKPLKLEKETFAQYGRIYYKNNPNVMKLVSEMLPKTSERMAVIINMII
ncbi:MAG: phage head morphogenesis protein, partial [Oscillospiraceae bacterium]|nr:phage head morphogenesis protein [Oscillospiraceae bacterium]